MRACVPALLLSVGLSACTGEARTVAPAVPQTRPLSDEDPRIPAYQGNAYQVGQGGRYFAWYGCVVCHDGEADAVRRLADGRWRRGPGFAAVYTAIADGHGAADYARRIPVETLWQITAYVRDLPRHTAEKRRRTALDQSAEPRGTVWRGPM